MKRNIEKIACESDISLTSKNTKIEKEWTRYPILLPPKHFDVIQRQENRRVCNVIHWLNKNRPGWVGNVLSHDLIAYIGKCAEPIAPVINGSGRTVSFFFDIAQKAIIYDEQRSVIDVPVNTYRSEKLSKYVDERLNQYCDVTVQHLLLRKSYKFTFFIYEGNYQHTINSFNYMFNYVDNFLKDHIPMIMQDKHDFDIETEVRDDSEYDFNTIVVKGVTRFSDTLDAEDYHDVFVYLDHAYHFYQIIHIFG